MFVVVFDLTSRWYQTSNPSQVRHCVHLSDLSSCDKKITRHKAAGGEKSDKHVTHWVSGYIDPLAHQCHRKKGCRWVMVRMCQVSSLVEHFAIHGPREVSAIAAACFYNDSNTRCPQVSRCRKSTAKPTTQLPLAVSRAPGDFCCVNAPEAVSLVLW